MELGNMIFGNSRGQHPVNRNLQDEFCELLGELGFDSYGNNDGPDWVFENDMFRMQPYHWGDCECGYEQREMSWCEANKHGANCYQTELKGRVEAWEISTGFKAVERRAFGEDKGPLSGFDTEVTQDGPATVMFSVPRTDDAMEAWRRAYDAKEKATRLIYQELCAKFGQPYPEGCAVHCTCDYRDRWQAWAVENDHAPDCLVVTPNFLHKPSGFRLDWYKYPLRDSYSSAPLTRKLMRSMFADCAASLAAQGIEAAPADETAQQAQP